MQSFFSGKLVPKVKKIGKLMTFMQAITFPMILLQLNFSIYFAIVTGLIGLFSGIEYIKDVTGYKPQKKQKRKRGKS